MKLGLGTAQFGSDYGVTNATGKVPPAEVERMLELAATSGIEVLDTAVAYGDSEAVLGRALGERHPFRVVTKCLPVKGERIGAAEARAVRDDFLRSLERLRQPAVHGLLVHQAADLRKPGAELLMQELQDLKRERLVSRIGASFYGVAETTLDIAQVPVSVADQRLVADGTLQRLHRAGVEIHARSVFLQGLLLADRIPPAFANRGLELIGTHARKAGISRLALALGFMASLRDVDVVLVGATTRAELAEIVAAASTVATGELAHLAIHDEELLNPSRWPTVHA